jgi:hypothetical protein
VQIFHQLAVPEILQECFSKNWNLSLQRIFRQLSVSEQVKTSQIVCCCSMLSEILWMFFKKWEFVLKNNVSDDYSRTD